MRNVINKNMNPQSAAYAICDSPEPINHMGQYVKIKDPAETHI